jgi:hypothetical protein
MTLLCRAAPPVAALLTAAALAACSSASSAPSQAAQAAACRQAAPAPALPAAAGSAKPGTVEWSATLARCTSSFGQRFPASAATATVTWAEAAPGGRLAVAEDGTLSMYSTAAGARLWARRVTPAAQPGSIETLDVSSSLVLLGVRTARAALYTFLNASTGQPDGKANTAVPGDPFLVGGHVVLDSTRSSVLEGYDPGTGKILWRTAVPDAPSSGAEVNDGAVVYLNSAASSGDFAPAMRRIDRLDAATGRLLPPLSLPRAQDFDLTTAGGNGFAQGLLVLQIVPPCSTPGCPVAQTIAVDPAAGTVKWSHPGDVGALPAGLFYAGEDQGGGQLTGVNPRTGHDAWTLYQQGLGTIGGADPLMLAPGFLTAWSAVSGTKGAVTGISPATGKQLWASTGFTDAITATSTASRVYVVSCTPWPQDSDSGLCSSITLTAVAT